MCTSKTKTPYNYNLKYIAEIKIKCEYLMKLNPSQNNANNHKKKTLMTCNYLLA